MIYVLDTNVLSEVMREKPHPAVVAWLRDCPPEAMCTTVISQSEILYGLRLLAEGGRRQRLKQAVRAMFAREFAGRILPFDAEAAERHAELRALRRQAGRPISTEDAMIAAVAFVHHATIVTRDAGGFADCGVPLIDPWMTAGTA